MKKIIYDKDRTTKCINRALNYHQIDDKIDYSTLNKDEKIHYFENKAIHEYWIEQDIKYLARLVIDLQNEIERLYSLLDDKEVKLRKAHERTLSVLFELHGIEVD